MLVLNIITLVLWIIVGLMDLIDSKPISKFSYGMMWFVLLLEILMKCIRS